MSFPEQIKTILDEAEYQFKEKGSLFVGRVYPINGSDEVESKLLKIRKEFHSATHNCFAYKLIQSEDYKYSDDGEPNGTAGIRIFNAIKHFGLSNVLVTSTRYFGGTKLGVGPLGKAYFNSAYGAIEAAKIVELHNYSEIKIDFQFDMISHVHHFLDQFDAKKIKNNYENNPNITCCINKNSVEKLDRELKTASKGSVEITIILENIFI